MLRIGILGAAKIAPAAVVKPARRNPMVAVVTSVAARDRERAAAFADKHGLPGTAPSYEALLADPAVDAVYNPLPNGLHGRWTLAALAAGKHVLCEKPFAADAAEARRVADAARDTRGPSGTPLVVMEAFHYRYHPLADRLATIVGSGELGPVRRIRVTFSAPLAKPGDIRYRADLAGGAMMDMGCYTVSLLRLLAGGEPVVVEARAKLSSPGVDRAMQADLTLPDGGSARLRCSMFSSSVLQMRAVVDGDDGTLRVWNPFAPQYGHRITVRTRSAGRSARSARTRRVEHVTKEPTYDFQLRAFAAAVRATVDPGAAADAGAAAIPTGPDDAVANMAVIDDVYRAAGLEPRRPTP